MNGFMLYSTLDMLGLAVRHQMLAANVLAWAAVGDASFVFTHSKIVCAAVAEERLLHRATKD
jgi:hypothetical protein